MPSADIEALAFRNVDNRDDNSDDEDILVTVSVDGDDRLTYSRCTIPSGEDLLSNHPRPQLAPGDNDSPTSDPTIDRPAPSSHTPLPRWRDIVSNVPLWNSRPATTHKPITSWRKRLVDNTQLRTTLKLCLSYKYFVLLWPALETITTMWLLSTGEQWNWTHMTNQQLRALLYFEEYLPIPEQINGIGLEQTGSPWDDLIQLSGMFFHYSEWYGIYSVMCKDVKRTLMVRESTYPAFPSPWEVSNLEGNKDLLMAVSSNPDLKSCMDEIYLNLRLIKELSPQQLPPTPISPDKETSVNNCNIPWRNIQDCTPTEQEYYLSAQVFWTKIRFSLPQFFWRESLLLTWEIAYQAGSWWQVEHLSLWTQEQFNRYKEEHVLPLAEKHNELFKDCVAFGQGYWNGQRVWDHLQILAPEIIEGLQPLRKANMLYMQYVWDRERLDHASNVITEVMRNYEVPDPLPEAASSS